MMIDRLQKYRYLILRRMLQVGMLILFAGSNWWGWKFVMGNYSSAYVLESFYLTDPHAVLQTLAAGFLISTDALAGAAIVLVFYAVIAGRSFCSWVCPVNIITDLAVWMRKRLDVFHTGKMIQISRYARYWILGLGFLLSALVGVAAFEIVNPITMLHRGIIFGFGIGWTLVVAVFLFDLVVAEFGWCGHLCPLGAMYTVIGRYALIKVKHEVEKCTSCMDCKDVCHEQQVLDFIGHHSGFIGGACSNCGRCIEVCEEKALKYSLNKIKIRRV